METVDLNSWAGITSATWLLVGVMGMLWREPLTARAQKILALVVALILSNGAKWFGIGLMEIHWFVLQFMAVISALGAGVFQDKVAKPLVETTHKTSKG